MTSYQQSIIIKSLKCTSSTEEQHTKLTSLCVSLHRSSLPWNSTAASLCFSSGPLAVGFVVTRSCGSITQTHTSVFSLVCLIKVKDTTFLSSEPQGTRSNLLRNMLMRLHHALLRDDGLETIWLTIPTRHPLSASKTCGSWLFFYFNIGWNTNRLY